MQLLGIQIKTPDLPSLVVVAFMGVVVCAITASLIYAGVATVYNGVAIATGVIGGSLANAYGVSVKESGWRGAILSSVFTLLLMGIVRGLLLLSN